MKGAQLIDIERDRQETGESYSLEQDLQLERGALAQAGACYLMVDLEPLVRLRWPFAPVLFKRQSFPYPSVRDMVKGGSLAAAAIDREQAQEAH